MLHEGCKRKESGSKLNKSMKPKDYLDSGVGRHEAREKVLEYH